MSPGEAAAFATLSLGGLISSRLLNAMLNLASRVDDAALVEAGVTLLSPVLRDGPAR